MDAQAFARLKQGPPGFLKMAPDEWNQVKHQFTEAQFKEANDIRFPPRVRAVAAGPITKPEFSELTSYDVTGGVQPPENSRLGWFIYFFSEARACNSKTATDVARMMQIFDVLFVRNTAAPATPKFTKRPDFDTSNAVTFKGYLVELMNIGFLKLPGDADGYSQNDATDVSLMKYVDRNDLSKPVRYAWRSDSRPYKDIEAAAGFLPKNASDNDVMVNGALTPYAQSKGMREPWNPFSDPAIRKYFWFRRNQNDNCLYSIVSVGKSTDWKSYLPFPKLDGWYAKQFLFWDQAGGKAKPVSKFEYVKAKCTVDGVKKELWLPATRTYLYFFVLSGAILDTEALQEHRKGDPFPEIAVKQIALKEIFGVVAFVRFHHGETDADGFTAVPDSAHSSLKDTNSAFITGKFSNAYTALRDEFDKAYRYTDIFHARWASTGYAELSGEDCYIKAEGHKIIVEGLA